MSYHRRDYDKLSGLDALDPAELPAACRIISEAAGDSGVHVVCGSLLYDGGDWWNAGIYFAPGREPGFTAR